VYARFIIGHPHADLQDAEAVEANLIAEAAVHGDIFRIPTVESYETLFLKSITYLRAAVAAVDAQYYIKTDDDMYVRFDRIPAVVAQWASDGAGYVGCLNINGPMESDPTSVEYEPLRAMLPRHSDVSHDGDRKWFGYMSGGFYAVSRQAAEWVTFRPNSMLRLMSGEDNSLGLQMLSLPVRTVEDRRLCSCRCTNTSVGKFGFCTVQTRHAPWSHNLSTYKQINHPITPSPVPPGQHAHSYDRRMVPRLCRDVQAE